MYLLDKGYEVPEAEALLDEWQYQRVSEEDLEASDEERSIEELHDTLGSLEEDQTLPEEAPPMCLSKEAVKELIWYAFQGGYIEQHTATSYLVWAGVRRDIAEKVVNKWHKVRPERPTPGEPTDYEMHLAEYAHTLIEMHPGVIALKQLYELLLPVNTQTTQLLNFIAPLTGGTTLAPTRTAIEDTDAMLRELELDQLVNLIPKIRRIRHLMTSTRNLLEALSASGNDLKQTEDLIDHDKYTDYGAEPEGDDDDALLRYL